MENVNQPQHSAGELRAISIVEELQSVLTDALKQLPGKPYEGIEAIYVSFVASALNRAADGYLSLRKQHRVAASKLMVRPIIELMINGGAAVRDKAFFHRKAYTEWEDDKKWMAKDDADRAGANTAFEEFKVWFGREYPGYPTVDDKHARISVFDAAVMAGVEWLYQEYYRPYCQFTHGSLRALMGFLDEHTDSRDTCCVGWCLSSMLNILRARTPAQVPDTTELSERLRRG